ncbi:prolactin 2 [Neoarius graeffei]|uniref:prolactin 2 n=1 Tax=Neoarius graeffei TaxID=443677 RepID=UPI00298C0310|nr:prolactin 2 [Neoarius graeffei]
MSSNQKQAVLFVAFLCLDLCTCMSTMPICAYGHTTCQLLSLANLFDRVIQHSARMHGLSSDLNSDLESYFLPGKNLTGSMYRKCHTSSILTPNNKEAAQTLAHEELTEVIVKLLMAWKYPLSLLHEIMSHQQDYDSFISSKALEMSNIALELWKGVEKVVKKMQLLGMINNSMNGFTSPEDLFPASGEAMSEYELLYCFHRDSDKVQNYLKILKCRILPDHGC